MKLLKTCLTVCTLVMAVIAQGRPPEAPRLASVNLASRSVHLGVAASGASTFSIFFSTSTGAARRSGNGEFRPSSARPGFYEAAYAVVDSSVGPSARVESGTLYFPIPAADADGDTVPDTADLGAEVDVVLEGDVVPNAADVATRVTQTPFSIRLQRAAGSASGSFTVDLIPGSQFAGNYSVLEATGTLQYRRTENGALLDYTLSNATTNATGSARVSDTNAIRTSAFRLRVSPTRRIRVGPATLTRTENIYRGEVVFSDGLDETPAPDFRSWVMQIVDLNDTDSDGVPNLSDLLTPFIAVQPRRQIARLGGTATFSVVVSGTGPFTYEWQQNGHEISNQEADPNRRVLVLPNVGSADPGSYRVIVRNAGGFTVSESTSLSLR
jgi:hypothetical protein